MKSNKIIQMIIMTIVIVLALIGCSTGRQVEGNDNIDQKDIKVGVCAGPYGDMFKEAIQPSLEGLGYTVKIIEFSDYVQPNNALDEKDIDVNMFQHTIYLEKFSKEYGLQISAITEIPTAAMGIFSDRYSSFEEIEDNSTIAIPNDDTNLARSLRVLAQTELITLDPKADVAKVTVNDILDNPKNLMFTEVSAEILPSLLDSVDIAVITGNYALAAGLNLADALYNEELLEGYFNVVAVRDEDLETQFAKDIMDIVHSDDFRAIIEDQEKQYSAFARPVGYKD